jgi:hypothetical protein
MLQFILILWPALHKQYERSSFLIFVITAITLGALICEDSLPRNSCFDVCEQLLVSEHHLLEVAEPEVDLDHLLECLEAPLPLLPVLQVQDPLEAVEGSLSDSAVHSIITLLYKNLTIIIE